MRQLPHLPHCSYRPGFSCNLWLKQELYLLLVESILIRANVDFCNERLHSQAELKFLHLIRFQFNLESSESNVYVILWENLASVHPEAIL